MCRLYGFISNHARKVECELIQSQNSLLVQSIHDERGESNADGWGLGIYRHLLPIVVRKPIAAYANDDFRNTAATFLRTFQKA